MALLWRWYLTYSFAVVTYIFLEAAVHTIFTISDAWLVSSLHALTEGEKNRSAHCATTWQWDGCMSGPAICAETYAKSVQTCVPLIVRPPTCRSFFFSLLLEHCKTCFYPDRFWRLKCWWMSLPWPLSLCTKHVFKEKEKKVETSNRKVRIYESGKMCGCKVNPVL